MKICWDNLEGVHLSRNGVFIKGSQSYIEKEKCSECGESYLTRKSKQSKFCGSFCAHIGKINPMQGKTHLIDSKRKMSIANTGKFHTIKTRKKISETWSKRVGFQFQIGMGM